MNACLRPAFGGLGSATGPALHGQCFTARSGGCILLCTSSTLSKLLLLCLIRVMERGAEGMRVCVIELLVVASSFAMHGVSVWTTVYHDWTLLTRL